MKTANFFQQGFDATSEQQNIDRQRKMAELLTQQSMQPLDNGRMVGNHFVPTAPTEGLAKMLQSYYGGQDSRAADAKQLALAKAIKGRDSEEFGKFTGMLTGTPASSQAPLTPNDDEGNINSNINIAAKSPDLEGAYKYAAGASNPALQQFGVQGALTNAQAQAQQSQAEAVRKQYGAFMSQPNMTAQAALAAGVPHDIVKSHFEAPNLGKQKLLSVNGQLVTELTGDKVGSAIPKQADAANLASDLLIPDGTGKLIPNASLIEAKKAIQKAGASNISNTVSGAAPENEYNKVVGKGLGEASLSLISSAQAAPEAIRSAQAIKNAIKNGAITGTGADVRQSVQKALETAGVVGEGKAATTQELISNLAKITLAGVKTSGLGAGNGFTDKDLKFLESGVSASFDSTPANLVRVADIAERVARANHAKGSSVAKRWSNDPALRNITQDVTIDAIPTSTAPTKPAAPAGIDALLKKYGGQ